MERNAYTQQSLVEEYYYKWHQAINDYRLTEPFYFDAQHTPPEYAEILTSILQNSMDMVDLLCNRIANGKSRKLYRDVLLLDKIGGINLWASEENANDNGLKAINKLVPIFQEEWNAGVYLAPDEKIKQLCENLMLEKDHMAISPRSLLSIRRYGIFAIPELVRQIKENNSKYAFAAFMGITHQKEYSEFIRKSNAQFIEKESKLDAIRKWREKAAQKGDISKGIMKRIEMSVIE